MTIFNPAGVLAASQVPEEVGKFTFVWEFKEGHMATWVYRFTDGSLVMSTEASDPTFHLGSLARIDYWIHTTTQNPITTDYLEFSICPPGPCALPSPARATSWGAIKAIYR